MKNGDSDDYSPIPSSNGGGVEKPYEDRSNNNDVAPSFSQTAKTEILKGHLESKPNSNNEYSAQTPMRNGAKGNDIVSNQSATDQSYSAEFMASQKTPTDAATVKYEVEKSVISSDGGD